MATTTSTSTIAHHKTVFVNVALVVLALAYVYHFVRQRIEVFGVGAVFENVNTTGCASFGKDIPYVQGCESMQVDSRTGLVYLACGNIAPRTRWLHLDDVYDPASEQHKDHVLVMDGRNDILRLRVLEPRRDHNGRVSLVPFTQDFRVHGFDIYWDEADPITLTFMFVNHQRSGDGISIFTHRLGTDFLEHVKTVKSPLLYSANDVVAMSRTTFYATNDVKHTSGILKKLEVFLGKPWSHIVRYSSEAGFSMAYRGIAYPNGIARSPDGQQIYVASSSDPSVNTFTPSPTDGHLVFRGKTKFRGLVPDNIWVDAKSGHLLVAGFLNTFEMFRYNHEVLRGTNAKPAAAIRRLRPHKNPKHGFAEENVLVHSGDLLPSTTMAVEQHHNGSKRMILGSVMASHIAICYNTG